MGVMWDHKSPFLDALRGVLCSGCPEIISSGEAQRTFLPWDKEIPMEISRDTSRLLAAGLATQLLTFLRTRTFDDEERRLSFWPRAPISGWVKERLHEVTPPFSWTL